MKRSSLALVIFGLLIQSWVSLCQELPDLESLYASSDPDLKWPPENANFDENSYETWPGAGERFGKSWPREKIPVVGGSISFKNFNKNYLKTKTPVVFHDLLKGMMPKFSLRQEDLKSNALASITYFQARKMAQDENKTMTLRDYFLHEDRNEYYIRNEIPKNIKTKIRVPDLLKCSDLLESMYQSQYNFYGHTVPLPLKESYQHRLICQVEGAREVLLIDKQDFPSWDDMEGMEDPEQGKVGTFFNVYALNYRSAPELKDIRKMYIAKLEENDCMFIPAGWIQQHNINGFDHSLEFSWTAKDKYRMCEESLFYKNFFVDIPFSKDKARVVEVSVDESRQHVDEQAFVINRYLFSETPVDLQMFLELIKEDPILMKDLEEWNEELQTSSKELFHILDRNEDQVLTAKDMDGLTSKKLKFWIGRTQDRLYDFREVIFDRKFDIHRGKNVEKSPEDLLKEAGPSLAGMKTDYYDKDEL